MSFINFCHNALQRCKLNANKTAVGKSVGLSAVVKDECLNVLFSQFFALLKDRNLCKKFKFISTCLLICSACDQYLSEENKVRAGSSTSTL